MELKGTVGLILSDPPCKDDNARFTTVLLKLLKPLSDQKCGQYCRFFRFKVFNSDNCRHSISIFDQTKLLRIVNQVLPSLHGDSLEITLTVPLIYYSLRSFVM